MTIQPVLRQILQTLPGEFEVVDTFEDGEEVLAAVERERPDLIVLDITLPGESGLVLASRLTKAGSSARSCFSPCTATLTTCGRRYAPERRATS